ncbi:MAG: hypothetical protein FJX23_02450 [Alphaproteobacteria bacterium]|nr:hypothetical protein [Alphaproteobacteria bacterium]
MTESSPKHQETKSAGRLGEKYYSGGEIRRVPDAAIHGSVHLNTFHVVDSKRVRDARGDTTQAVELTLKIAGPNAQRIIAQAQPGLYFAFEPKNRKDDVDAVLSVLKPSPQEKDGRISIPVHSDRMGKEVAQNLPKRDVLAGLVDISRPTEQLVNMLAKRAEEAGNPLPKGFNATEIAQCYTVPELLAYRPNVLTLEEVAANQPPMKSRPYTISDFDKRNGTVNILVSGVDAKLPAGDPLGIKKHENERQKDGGTATGMLLDIAESKASDYPINGYLITELPRLMFPGIMERTDAVNNLVVNNPRIGKYLDEFEAGAKDKTLYMLGTGSGMAPYMSLLRELSRRQKADPEHKKPYAGKIVVVNGGRYAEDELYAKECRGYVQDGIIDAYHATSSSDGKERFVTLKDGKLNEQEVQGYSKTGKYYIQDVLEAAYGSHMDKDIREGKAMVYVCGTQGALRGVFSKWTEAFRANPVSLQHTASIPGRFFQGFWRGRNDVTSHREPMPEENRSEANPASWTRRVLKIVEVREGAAARGQKTAAQGQAR